MPLCWKYSWRPSPIAYWFQNPLNLFTVPFPLRLTYYTYHCRPLSGKCLLWTLILCFSPHFLPPFPYFLASFTIPGPLLEYGCPHFLFCILFFFLTSWCTLQSLTLMMAIICFLPNTLNVPDYGFYIRRFLTFLHIKVAC